MITGPGMGIYPPAGAYGAGVAYPPYGGAPGYPGY